MAKKRLSGDQEVKMDTYSAKLTATLARRFRKLGGGNFSEGIRLAGEAIDQAKPVERRKGPPDRRRKKK